MGRRRVGAGGLRIGCRERAAEDDWPMSAVGYQSWFVSARDPEAPRALWIRHTVHRPRDTPSSAALWCTVVDHDLCERPSVVKQVFAGHHPAEALAEPARFRGGASAGQRAARWDLAIAPGEAPLRPLRPGWLYGAPVPRTKLEVPVPDGLISGTLEVGGREVGVSGWRGTVGHNGGSEHADSWAWLHAAGSGAAPDGWMELVLARIRVGPARSPWLAMGALSAGGERFWVGGFGRRPEADVRPGALTARIPCPGAWLELSVSTSADDAVAVTYADPSGGSRRVRHAALARVDLILHRKDGRDITMTTSKGAYEYGTRQGMDEIEVEPLPDG